MHEQVKEWFDYRDGALYWKDTNNRLGHQDGKYRTIYFNSKRYREHRIVFLWHHGYMPPIVDHIDGNPSNNRIENLRPATQAQNQQNKPKTANNNSGIKGVSWHRQTKKWKGTIFANGTPHHIGYWSDLEEARATMVQARLKYHKEFANHN